MIAICVANRGSDLGQPARGHLYSERSTFHLTVGTTYVVMGMGIFDSTMVALVCDDTGKPNWLPVGLFELTPQKFPDNWEFRLFDGRAASGGNTVGGWVARWGYPDLVRDEQHVDRLIERDPLALRTFFTELKEATD